MIRVFNGKWRGLEAGEDKALGMIFGFKFRDVLHEFQGAKLHVFMAITLHLNEEGEAWPSYDTLQRETGYSRATIANAIDELDKMTIKGRRILIKYRLRDSEGKFTGSNRYRVFPTDEEIQSLLFPTLEKSNGGETKLEVKPSTKEKPKIKVAPNGAEPPEPPRIKITNKIRKHAETVFREVTGLEPLPGTSRKSKDQNSIRWWQPLRTICEVAEADEERVEALIRGAVKELGMKYVYAPQSLINTIPKIKARLNGSTGKTEYAEVYE